MALRSADPGGAARAATVSFKEVGVHIGLIVGIGPAATDYYYRSLISRMATVPAELQLTMVHADTATLLAHQAAGDVQAQVDVYERLTRRLHAAGARSVAVTSIAGHFCIDVFEQVSVLPVIDILSVVSAGVRARGYARVGLLGTRKVMESHFYGALSGVEVVLPVGPSLDAVHEAYVQVASTATCTDAQRKGFFDAGRALVEEQGAEAVLLAGTDLALAFNGFEAGFPVFDCADAHVDAIVAEAIRP
jgi:aspartate racemase